MVKKLVNTIIPTLTGCLSFLDIIVPIIANRRIVASTINILKSAIHIFGNHIFIFVMGKNIKGVILRKLWE